MNRKLISLIFSIALSLSVFSCSKYDDTKVWNELNSLDSRVEKLETLCSQMNTNISSLQTIVAALQNNDGITNVYQLPNGEGYTITFTSGKTITIYNGADGKDGTNGKDGADGKDGKDGDTIFSSVVENEDNVVFTLADGTQITIDKSKSLSISFEASEIGVEPGKSKEMTYTLTGASANVKVKVIAQDGWSAKLTSSSQTGGVIRVAAPYASAESEVTVLVSDGSSTIMSSFICIRKDKDADLTIVVVSDRVSIPMVWVEEDVHGFWMGSEGFISNETPAHKVQLSGFYICKYEVT